MPPVTFLTGASSGLGRALAPLLARDGHAVALAARREEELRTTARAVRDVGGRARVFPLDVTDGEAVRDAIGACGRETGPVERIVANAGIGQDTPADDLDAGVVARILEVNVTGAVHAVAAALPGMLERDRGHVVGISSLAALRGLPRTGAYSASKAALSTFLESLRVDLRETGVDVTTIHPGYVRTPMTDRSRHPLPHLVELDDAAARIHRTIRARKRVDYFPWPLAVQIRIARLLPPAVYDWLASRFVEREKEPDPRLE